MQVRSKREDVVVPSKIQSAQAKLVYVYLATTGETTAAALSRALDVPQLAVRSVLQTLARKGYVERSGDTVRPVPVSSDFDE